MVIYSCDKEKNKECTKKHCGTYCNHTTNFKYAKKTPLNLLKFIKNEMDRTEI